MAAALTNFGLKRVRSDWQGAVLVCGKCSRKIDGGFGANGRTPLAKALRRATGLGKGRKKAIGIVETRCLGICPKHAVVLIDTRALGEWLIVPAGTDPTTIQRRLFLERDPPAQA